jgi:hypothetical protein
VREPGVAILCQVGKKMLQLFYSTINMLAVFLRTKTLAFCDSTKTLKEGQVKIVKAIQCTIFARVYHSAGASILA